MSRMIDTITNVSCFHEWDQVCPDLGLDSVNRVNWLSARAQKNRWAEEKELINHEMGWTVRYYLHMSKTWANRSRLPTGGPGHLAYANKQEALWLNMARAADSLFVVKCPEYRTVM